MKKRILSVVLIIALTLSCFSGVHAAQPGAGSAFNPDDHLIKVSDDRYQIVSLNGAVTMNLFTDASGQWSYSLDKTPMAQTSETLVLGNVDFDAEGKVTVLDILKIKSIILPASARSVKDWPRMSIRTSKATWMWPILLRSRMPSCRSSL